MRLSIFGFDPFNKNAKPQVVATSSALPTQNNSKPSKKGLFSFIKLKIFKNKLFLLVVFSLFLFSGTVIYIFIQGGFTSEVKESKIYDGLPFDKSKYEKGVFVGNVTVYWEDLLRKYNLLYDSTPENWSNLANWKVVLNQVNSDAILQNEGIRRKIFEEGDNSKLDPNKVNKARIFFDTKGKAYISGEAISIWFKNESDPKMGIEAAKKMTLDYLTEVRAKILANEITMKDGGDLISSNFKLAEIDPNYQTNAYLKFNYIGIEDPLFTDASLDAELKNLKLGTVSEIFTGHDYKDGSKNAAFYIIIKINDKSDPLLSPYSSAEQIVRKRILEGYKLEL